ncbi:hypothetical protein QUB47_36010, partial [Microcoleus sp. AT9_B5]
MCTVLLGRCTDRSGDRTFGISNFKYTTTDTETQPETTPNLPQKNQPLIGIIDTGFTTNNPHINYSKI